MSEVHGPKGEVDLVLGIAEALREEFGAVIDAHPGGIGTPPGSINRAFLASARHILKAIVPPSGDLPGLTTRVLRLAARRRLAEFSLSENTAETLIDSEPAFGDSWLIYLALAPDSVIEDAVDGEGKIG